MERIDGHASEVGGLPIRRLVPTARRRLIGAWCFMDHAGPATLPSATALRVAPHPHTGLQTFSWMIEGEILHRDSLGSVQLLRPGQVNLMTAGRGIAHSEESMTAQLHLVQLWIALPEGQRFCAPAFEHFATLPTRSQDGFELTLLTGRHGGLQSPVPQHTPLLGLDLAAAAAAETTLALDPAFEHGFMVLEGAIESADGPIEPGTLAYLAPGISSLRLRCHGPARVLLLGGLPLQEPVLLWWNFVGRSGEEIKQFAADWNRNTGSFAGVDVQGFEGSRLLAPAMPMIARAG